MPGMRLFAAILPPRDVLLAQLAGAFQAPMVKLAGLLQALPRNFAYGLAALIDQRGGPEAPAEPATDAAAAEAESATDAAAAEAESATEAPATEAPADTPTPAADAD